jgi:hypothetical protein
MTWFHLYTHLSGITTHHLSILLAVLILNISFAATSILWIEDGASAIWKTGFKGVTPGFHPFHCPVTIPSLAVQNWRLYWKTNTHPDQHFYNDHWRFLLLRNKPSFCPG